MNIRPPPNYRSGGAIRDIPKQTKATGPQADLDTGQRLTALAITLIFPPSCDHAF